MNRHAEMDVAALTPRMFLRPEDIDRVGLALLTLTQELSVLRARQRVLEAALVEHGVDVSATLESAPTAVTAAAIEKDRNELIARIVSVLSAAD